MARPVGSGGTRKPAAKKPAPKPKAKYDAAWAKFETKKAPKPKAKGPYTEFYNKGRTAVRYNADGSVKKGR